MTAMEASFYSAFIAVVFVLVYLWSSINIEHFLLKFESPCRLRAKVGCEELKHNETLLVATQEDQAGKLSSQWWTDEKQFELEKRAIFCKSWLFVTHASRYQKPGDYRTFEIAGFSIIVILGKDRKLRTFHNVCRHRAYTVTKKESGSSTVLRCRYHGWSYDTKGNLIKAPEFGGVDGFDKSLNGLWELRTEVIEGTVFVNFEVGNSMNGVSKSEMNCIKSWGIGKMRWTHEWKIEGSFNWKLAADMFSDISRKGSSWTLTLPYFCTRSERLLLSHTTILRRLTSQRLLILRVLPLSTSRTLVECSIYERNPRHNKATQLELQRTKMEVDLEMKSLESQQEVLLDRESDFLSPSQDTLIEVLRRHSRAEIEIGQEIHPAARKQSTTPEGMTDDDLCKELNLEIRDAVCGVKSRDSLEW